VMLQCAWSDCRASTNPLAPSSKFCIYLTDVVIR
jgi:hypothetical protein